MSGFHRKRSVSVNDRGHVVGQDHHRARLTDHEVELVRALRDEGMQLAEIGEKFDIDRRTAARYCAGTRRAQLGTDQKLVSQRLTRYKHRRPARAEEFDGGP